MEFKLPSNLQQQVVAYDPTLAPLAKATKKSSSPGKKAKYPVGNPPALLPVHIVSAERQQEAIDRINTVAAPQRYHRFLAEDHKLKAIIYHFESVWVAAWFPSADQKDEYLYGYTYAVRNTAASFNAICSSIRLEIDSYTQVKVGRSEYYIKTVLVTKQDVVKRYPIYTCLEKWDRVHYCQKGRSIKDCTRAFGAALQEAIPTWSDRSTFDRLRDQASLPEMLFGRTTDEILERYYALCEERYQIKRDKWYPTVDNIDLWAFVTNSSATTSIGIINSKFKEVAHIINTPFFRKWFQEKFNEVIENVYNNEVKAQEAALGPWKHANAVLNHIARINEVWPDTPIDHYRVNLSSLLTVESRTVPANVRPWLNRNMPVTSYFSMISKLTEAALLENNSRSNQDFSYSYYYSRERQAFIVNPRHWNDTIEMLSQLLAADVPIEAPKRWRISEFHDHVQVEAWKLKNPNENLPQDLFPAPISFEYDSNKWTFFQPRDTHQLSAWGQAIRNCIGNASSYAEGVRKKKHFLVLCMLNNEPRFTVQLTVNNGTLFVNQIVGFANSSLSVEDKEKYTNAFAQALQAQESRLQSEAVAS